MLTITCLCGNDTWHILVPDAIHTAEDVVWQCTRCKQEYVEE